MHSSPHLSLEQMFVVVHGIPVGESADFVFQHFLVNTKVSVRVEVVVAARHLLRLGGARAVRLDWCHLHRCCLRCFRLKGDSVRQMFSILQFSRSDFALC